MSTFILSNRTKAEKLLDILEDGRWHTTRELVRRCGHTFAVAKFYLIKMGFTIERERHPSTKYQHQYRLIDGPNG